jgi:DNA polymerase III alpha subunit
MRSLIAKMRPANIRDCILAVAIIRPGAAAGGAKESFIRRRAGEEIPEYAHPSLRPVLEESLGIIIYEEDVMCVASAIAGISLAEGDRLRSRLKKCRHPEDARDLENDFLRRAVGRGVEPDVARAIWADLRKFAAYCFSKAHAAGYGVLAWQSAYLKAHAPTEFACAVLNNHAGMYSTRTIAEEVKRLGVQILPPCVQRSGLRFGVERAAPVEDGAVERAGPTETGSVRVGLSRLKGLSREAIEAILETRSRHGPFRGFTDFLERVRLPRREVEALIFAGAFHALPPPPGREAPLNQPQLLWELESTPPSKEAIWIEFGGGSPRHPELPPYDRWTRLHHELRVLDLALGEHPLRLLRGEARAHGCISTLDASRAIGRRVRVAGLLAATRPVRTARGGLMRFLTLEDETGLLEATIFPRALEAFAGLLTTLGPYVVEGTVEDDHGAVNLRVLRLEVWRPMGTPVRA